MSSITVAGITPTLSILGAFQEFIYDQNSSAFRLYNNFVPTISIDSKTNFEYRNNTLSGFRWVHTTNNTDVIGQLTLQNFVSASEAGTDMISFNNDGSISFLAPVDFPSVFDVTGSTQTFLYNVPVAQFILKNDAVDSDIAYVLNSDSTVRSNFGYKHSTNETCIESLSSLSFYINSPSTPQFKINSTTGKMEINTEVIASSNSPLYTFTLNNEHLTGGTGYVISNNNIEELTLGYDKGINMSFLESNSSLDIIINGETTCVFNESDIGFNNNPIINAVWNGAPVTVSYGGTGQSSLTTHSLLVGDGTSSITQLSVGETGTILVGNSGADPSFSSAPIVNSMTILNAPVSSTDAITKGYVDALSAGLFFKNSCEVATTSNLNAAYLNGTSGIGATLTNLGTLAAFTVDGQSPPVNSRILVKNQTTSFQNGIYVLTTVGSVSVAWVLTRAVDFDSGIEIQSGDVIPVEAGTVTGLTSWLQTATVNIIGTDAISFAPFTYSPAAFLEVANNLSDLTNTTTARANLGLSNVATQTLTQYSVLLGSASNAISSLAVPSVANQILLSGASTNPSWSTNTVTLGGNLVTSGANSLTLTTTAATNVILPTTGTLVNSNVATLSSLVSVGTITTGVWNGTPVTVPFGGTGLSTTTAYGVICGGTTSTGNFQNTGIGTIGQVLTSNGPGALPTWQASSYGSMYMQSNASASNTTIFIKTTGTTIAGSNLNNFTHTNGRLAYTGSNTIVVCASGSVWSSYAVSNNVHTYTFAKNGTVITESVTQGSPQGGGGTKFNIPFSVIVQLSTNDYLEVYMKNSAANNMTPIDMIVTIVQV
jgi:hypothetical protein